MANVRIEMNKVSWPTKDELLNSTYIVIILSTLLSMFIFGVDTLLTNVIRLFIG